MHFLSFPLLSFGIGLLLVTALWALKAAQPRLTAIFGATGAFVCFLCSAFEVSAAGHERLFDPWLHCFEADALDAVPMAFFAALTLGVIILMPRRDATGRAAGSGQRVLQKSAKRLEGFANTKRLSAYRHEVRESGFGRSLRC